ncbi:MAG: anti-sigma factor antagonist [Clostridia bacterium]|nr:anti-sigma factor antagonist [Clostridia bacterium]
MEVNIQTEPGRVIARLRGEIDHHAAIRLREKLDRVIEGGEYSLLILDFSEISFMDSSGIGLVLGRYKLMKRLGGHLLVRGACSRILWMMQMAGLEKLQIFETERTKKHETDE